MEYSLNAEEPLTVLPDIDCLKKDVVLLVDTFFNVILWRGLNIKAWMDQNFHKDPQYEHLAKMIENSEKDSNETIEQRVLYPNKIQAHFGSPTERLLKSKLNPENKTMVGANEAMDSGNFISDEATLSSFVAKILQFLSQH